MQFDAGLLNYNITAQRAIFDLFAKKVKHDPSLVYSFVVMEGYSTEGVDTVDPVLSSFALRDDKLLVFVTSAPSITSNADNVTVPSISSIRPTRVWTSSQLSGAAKLVLSSTTANLDVSQLPISTTRLEMSQLRRSTGMSHGVSRSCGISSASMTRTAGSATSILLHSRRLLLSNCRSFEIERKEEPR